MGNSELRKFPRKPNRSLAGYVPRLGATPLKTVTLVHSRGVHDPRLKRTRAPLKGIGCNRHPAAGSPVQTIASFPSGASSGETLAIPE